MKLYNWKTSQEEEVPSEIAEGYIRAGTHSPYEDDDVPLVDRFGNVTTFKGIKVNDMLKSGMRLPTQDISNVAKEEQVYDNSNFQAATAAVLRGISLGFSDEILTSEFGVKPEHLEKLRKYNPYLSTTTEIGSAIAPVMFSGGAGLAARIASKLPTAVLNKATLNVGALGSKALAKGVPGALESSNTIKAIVDYAGKGLGSAVEGAAYGAGNYVTEQALGGPDYSGENLFAHAAEGAKWGGALGIAIPGILDGGKKLISKFPGGLEWTATKAVKTYATIPEDTIKQYLDDPALYDNSLSKEEVLSKILDARNVILEKLSNKQIELEQAKQYADVLKINFKDRGTNIQEAIDDFQKIIKERIAERKLEIKNSPIPEYTVEDVGKVIRLANEERNRLSQEAYGLLDNYPDQTLGMDMSDLVSKAKAISRERFVTKKGQVVPVGPLEKSEYKFMQDYINDLIEYGSKISKRLSLREIKGRIQSIDKEIAGEWGVTASEKDIMFLKAIRSELDTFLKGNVKEFADNPSYQEKMLAVSELSDLTSQLNRRYGMYDKPNFYENVRGKIDGILKGSNTSNMDLDLVKRAQGWLVGNPNLPSIPVEKQIDEILKEYKFAINQGAKKRREEAKYAIVNPELRDIVKDLNASRIELSDYNRVKRYVDKDFNDYLQANVIDKIDKFESAKQLKGQKGKIADLQAELKQIQKDLSEFNGFESKDKGLETLERRTHVANKTKVQATFGRMAELSDPDLVNLVDILRVKQAFNNTIIRGSRNVNLWSLMFAGSFGTTGGIMAGIPGMAAGAIVGAIVDNYGPRIAKNILRGISKLKGVTPSKIQKVINENIPEQQQIFEDLHVKTLGKIEKDNQSTNKEIKESLSEYFDKPITAAKIFTSKYMTTDYETEKKRLETHIQARQNVNENFYAQNELLSPVIPNIMDNYFNTYQRASDYIDKSIPRSKEPDLFGEFKPTNVEEYKFAQIAHYVENPMSIFKEIKSGTIPYEGIEVLKNVYPAIYDRFLEVLSDKLTNPEEAKKIPISKRNELQRMFGVNLNSSMNYQNMMQLQMYGDKEQKELEDQKKGLKKVNPDLTQGTRTDMERIQNKV